MRTKRGRRRGSALLSFRTKTQFTKSGFHRLCFAFPMMHDIKIKEAIFPLRFLRRLLTPLQNLCSGFLLFDLNNKQPRKC